MTRFAIGLGSNDGDRLAHLTDAVEAIGSISSQNLVSGLYETEPVGGPEQNPFLNAVMVIDTDLDPHDLLQRLHEIELAAGRERDARWGPRTLDLDIVAIDGPPVTSEGLVVPHPRASRREFVLRPLTEVWAEAEVGTGVTASEALPGVDGQGVDLLAREWVEGLSSLPGRLFVGAQVLWFLAVGVALAIDGSLPESDVSGTRLVGAGMAVLGMILGLASMRRLGPGMTAVPEPREGGFFVDEGLYRHVRHPIYGGVVLSLLGASLFFDSVIGSVLSLGLLGFFYLKSGYEERRLRIAYPEYRAYQQSVRRRMIPFLF